MLLWSRPWRFASRILTQLRPWPPGTTEPGPCPRPCRYASRATGVCRMSGSTPARRGGASARRRVALGGSGRPLRCGLVEIALRGIPAQAERGRRGSEGSPPRGEGRTIPAGGGNLPKRAAEPKHHDALHWSEVAGALAKIDATNCAPTTKRAIRFTALTTARQVEVQRATWDQFDLEAAVWTKPAESMKTGKAHRVRVSRQALELIREARGGVRGDSLLFPGSRPGTIPGGDRSSPPPRAWRPEDEAASAGGRAVDLWTSPADRRAPFGARLSPTTPQLRQQVFLLEKKKGPNRKKGTLLLCVDMSPQVGGCRWGRKDYD